MNDKLKMKKIIFALMICVLMVILVLAKVYQCPIKALVGIPCPTCGLTRACLSALKGDISKAFYYYPLWPIIIIAIVGHILIELTIIKPSHKFNTIALIIIALAILICFMVRHMVHSPVVEIDIQASCIYRLYQYFSSIITTVAVSFGVSSNFFASIKEVSKFFIIWAMAAIGLNTNIVKLVKTGGKPLLMGLSCWGGITIVSLGIQHVMGLW